MLIASSEQAMTAAREILKLFERNRRQLAASPSAMTVFEQLQKRPISSVTQLQQAAGLTYPTVSAALERMKKLGFVTELTGGKRNRLFAYAPYIAILSEGAEPVPRRSP